MTEPQFNSDSTDSSLSRTMTSMPDAEMCLSLLANYHKSMKAQHETWKDNKNNLDRKLTQANDTIDKLKIELDNTKNENEQLKIELDNTKNENEQLKIALDHAEDEIKDLNQRADPYSSDGCSIEDGRNSGNDE